MVVIPLVKSKSRACDWNPGQWRVKEVDAFCFVGMCIGMRDAYIRTNVLRHFLDPFEARNPVMLSILLGLRDDMVCGHE